MTQIIDRFRYAKAATKSTQIFDSTCRRPGKSVEVRVAHTGSSNHLIKCINRYCFTEIAAQRTQILHAILFCPKKSMKLREITSRDHGSPNHVAEEIYPFCQAIAPAERAQILHVVTLCPQKSVATFVPDQR